MKETDNNNPADTVVLTRPERDDKRPGPQLFRLSAGTQGVTVALIEALSRLSWPAVVCWALVMFQGPVYDTLSAAAAKPVVKDEASLDVAGLKFSLTKNTIQP